MSFEGKSIVITGASRGLGRAMARRFADAGAALYLVARDVSSLRIDGAKTLSADLARPEQVEGVIHWWPREGPDVLINNAAIQGPLGPFEKANFAAWQEVMQVNFLAPARLCQAAIPGMRKRGHGKIINLSGGGATSPRPDASAYGASKCALVRLSETLARETAGSGIDINCIAPGPMNTRMLDELIAAGPTGATLEYDKALRQKKEGGTPPEKAVDLAMFLASGAGDGITGRLISAVWDRWEALESRKDELAKSDIFTLRRIVPEERGKSW